VVLEQLAEFSNSTRAVLSRHTLDARADTDLDGTAFDSVGNVHASLKARRALPVQRLDGGRARETSSKSRSAELGGTTAGGEHITNGDVFDETGIDARALKQALESTDEEISTSGVLEAATAALGDGCAEGSGNDDVVGVFLNYAWSAGSIHVMRDLLEAALGVLVLA
jgi:hypothetical protein